MSDQSSVYAVLAGLPADAPASLVLPELLRSLAVACAAAEVGLWWAEGGVLRRDVTWPVRVLDARDGSRVTRVGRDDPVPGAYAEVPLPDDGADAGRLVLVAGPKTRTDHKLRGLLEETANCIVLVRRRERVRRRVHQQVRYTLRLSGELTDSGRRLATVGELERRRITTEIFAIGATRLTGLGHLVDQMDADLAEGAHLDPSAVAGQRDLLGSLIDDFRTMVRGIHPQVLHARGVRAALAEVAAALDDQAIITGSIPSRIEPELGAAIYRFTASALQFLVPRGQIGRPRPADALRVRLSQAGGRIGVEVIGPAVISRSQLRAALTIDADRIVALGGRVEIGRVDVGRRDQGSIDGGMEVRATVPDRLEPDPIPGREAAAPLVFRIRSVALGILSQYPDGPGADRVQYLLGRLDAPVRLGVLDDCWSLDPASFGLLDRRLPDLELVPSPVIGPNGADGPLSDVFLRPAAVDLFRVEHPGHRFDIVLHGAGLLARSVHWEDLPGALTAEVAARTDLLRARTLVNSLGALLRDVRLTGPAATWFAYELEELRTGTRDLQELEALAWLRAGVPGLREDLAAFADRLLRSAGSPAHERLGLPASAAPEQLQDLARRQIAIWRRAVGSAGARRQRQVFRVIEESCEGLLAATLTNGGNDAEESDGLRPRS